LSASCNFDFWQSELKKIDLSIIKKVYDWKADITPTLYIIMEKFVKNGQDLKRALIDASDLASAKTFFAYELEKVIARVVGSLVLLATVNAFMEKIINYYADSEEVEIIEVQVNPIFSPIFKFKDKYSDWTDTIKLDVTLLYYNIMLELPKVFEFLDKSSISLIWSQNMNKYLAEESSLALLNPKKFIEILAEKDGIEK